jgi:hypothetical protein
MKDCPKSFAVCMIAAMAVVLLLVLNSALQAGEVAAAPPKVLGVDDFMKNVERYRGKVSLEGVVSAVVPEQQALSLIDAKEFQACDGTTCAKLTLPVKWRGPMPVLSDLVRVEGQAQEVNGKLIFVADKVDKVARP